MSFLGNCGNFMRIFLHQKHIKIGLNVVVLTNQIPLLWQKNFRTIIKLET